MIIPYPKRAKLSGQGRYSLVRLSSEKALNVIYHDGFAKPIEQEYRGRITGATPRLSLTRRNIPSGSIGRLRPVVQDQIFQRGNPSVALVICDRQTPRNGLGIELERLQLRESEKDILKRFLPADHTRGASRV